MLLLQQYRYVCAFGRGPEERQRLLAAQELPDLAGERDQDHPHGKEKQKK